MQNGGDELKMNANASKMLNAYGVSQYDIGVSTASPHKLISMLYDGALVAIANANVEFSRGNVAARGTWISRAISIIDEGLKVSINLDVGGELAKNLMSLYEYMIFRLLNANLKSEKAGLSEVEALLKELKSAWEAIGNVPVKNPVANEAEAPRTAVSYGMA
ncbi:flagellar protein FliS [mine drainage metagenome]|uniref:Flagellar protein FliS n=1 Tax=mine drainage metagenome TaxID=410659 RepID=A0A1J5QP84_9ZZZZ